MFNDSSEAWERPNEQKRPAGEQHVPEDHKQLHPFYNVEFGLRLAYQIRSHIAPYVGVSFDHSFFGTSTLVRQSGGVELTRFRGRFWT